MLLVQKEMLVQQEPREPKVYKEAEDLKERKALWELKEQLEHKEAEDLRVPKELREF